MKTSELHTLKSILTEGIEIEGGDIHVSCVYIPKIQRAYAQGRNEESYIRKDFLETLFGALISEDERAIELGFLFGSKQFVAKKSTEGFELLDGQQRTTTLFLLYWYVSMKEKGCVPEFLSKFTYETRDTSTQFLENITPKNSKISIKENIPSDAIKNNKWFTDDYYCDPTVCAMLNMLDSIDEMYLKYNCSNILDNLERLKFYVLMLDKFDMNDELYIKMNSRGLSLTPFENFKASIVQYMKSDKRNGLYGTANVENDNPPFWFTFISNMDAKWIDIFWSYNPSDKERDQVCDREIKIDDRLIGTRYFNFINRYLFTKAALADNLSNSKIGSLTSFFYYNEAETDEMKSRFSGWEFYDQIFQQYEGTVSIEDTLFYKLQKVFNTFREYKKYVEQRVQNNSFDRTNKFEIGASKFTDHNRVAFAAVTEFIENMPEGATLDQENVRSNFERMLRVASNIIENTPNNVEEDVQLIKTFSKLISAQGAITDNFYKSLATAKFKSNNDQLKEEILKAKEMFSDKWEYIPEWEKAFIDAEKHPFFKGSILFFFTEKFGNSDAFTARYNVVKKLFDKNGISKEYQKDYILFRALLSQLNFWDNGLCDLGIYLTESEETQKNLKKEIVCRKEIRKMFCDYFDSNDINRKPIKEYFGELIEKAVPKEKESVGFKLLFKRLVNDSTSVHLLEWVKKTEEEEGKKFIIQENGHSLVINIYRTKTNRWILDTERHLIIPNLVNKYSMKYSDPEQEKMIKSPIKDVSNWDISIEKSVAGESGIFTLKLTFTLEKDVTFDVVKRPKGLSDSDLSSVKYQLFEDRRNIEKRIEGIINKLKRL